jgi:hypothetical protein
MQNYETLSKEQLISHIIAMAVAYNKRFNKNLGITAEIGEYKAAKLLSLIRVDGNINPGFDAWDNKKKVQIKTRIYNRKTERTGNFSKHDYDYALLVLLSDKYEVIEIYKATNKKITEAIETQGYKRPSLPISKFIEIGQRIYPK